MPRHNRTGKDSSDAEQWDPSALRAGWRRTQTRRGALWNVQPVTGEGADKQYVCPGCGRVILPGTAHLVAWRADGVLGDESDLAGRRHWHEHCWRVG